MRPVDRIPEIRAEMLLNYLYPELATKWMVSDKGSFYRNYNDDIMSLYLDERRVELSRDGFLKLLPEGVLCNDDEFKKGDTLEKYKELKRREHLLNEAFLPFDTFQFRYFLQIERQVSGLLNDKLEYILRHYFDYDIEAEQNPYVKRVAVLLPFAKQWRGDFGMVRNLLSGLFDCEVLMHQGRYSYSDTSRQWLPFVRYDLLIEGLEPEAFRELYGHLQSLKTFLSDWFMPVEVVCQINIKEYNQPQQVNTRLVLDYNSEVIK